MVIKREVAYGIVRGMEVFWKCEELQDFTVTLGTVHFGCHRFLLAACSGFFRGLFRSGMKETEQKCTTLKNISCRTFELILETMYTGHGVLTNDNVIDIWRAAHQLQIHFLVSECENFVIETLSLENYVDYFHTCKTLNSYVVMDTIWRFILKNSNSFFQTSDFLELPLAEVLRLIKCQDLKTRSEDDVIHAILKWVEYTPYIEPQNELSKPEVTDSEEKTIDHQINQTVCEKFSRNGEDVFEASDKHHNSNKGDKLFQAELCFENVDDDYIRHHTVTVLLFQARLCLASPKCLEMLLRHPLIRDNREVREKATDALLYQLQNDKRNGQWPFGALHRNFSPFENVAVAALKNGNEVTINVFSFSRNAWWRLPNLSIRKTLNFAVIGASLYAMGINVSNEVICGQRFTASPPVQSLFGSCAASTHTNIFTVSQTPCTQNSISPKEVFKNPLLLFRMTDGHWKEIKVPLTLPSDNFFVAVVDTSMYIFSYHGETVSKLDTKSQNITSLEASLPNEQNICHVMSCDEWILVFYALTVEGVDETVVYCYNTTQDTWTKLNNLEGPAIGMTSFKDDHFTYLLQSNGDMWKVVKPQSNIIDFEFVVKLWGCDWHLHGAVIFLDALHIFGAKSDSLQNDTHQRRSLPGVFDKIIYQEITPVDNSAVTPIILNKKHFA